MAAGQIKDARKNDAAWYVCTFAGQDDANRD